MQPVGWPTGAPLALAWALGPGAHPARPARPVRWRSVRQKVQHHAVELVGVLPLRPVAAAAEHVQLGVGQAPHQAQAHVQGHKAVVAAPDDQRLRRDFAQAVAVIGELLGVGRAAFDEIFQVVAARQHVVQARLVQRVGQAAGVVDKHIHHALEVLDAGVAVERANQLDALGGHGHKLAGAAGAAAHQHQLAHARGVGQCKGHGAVRAHGVADDVDFVQTDGVHQALQRAGVQVGARAGVDDGVAFAPAGAVQQDDAVARRHQGLDVAVEVGPAAGAGARAVQHDHGFGALADVVVVQLQVQVAFLDADKSAGGGFGQGGGGVGHGVCRVGGAIK